MSLPALPTQRASCFSARTNYALLVCCWSFAATLLIDPFVPAHIAHAQRPDPRSERLAKAAIEEAKTLLENNQTDAAVVALKTFIATDTRSAYLDDAYLLLAGALSTQREYEQAILYLELLLSQFPSSDLAGRARLMLGIAHAELGDPDTGLAILAEARTLDPTPQTKRDSLKLSGEILIKRGDYLRGVRAWLEEMALVPDADRVEIRERIHTLIQLKMDTTALKRLRDAYPATYPGDLALIRLIELEIQRGDQHLAERNLRTFLVRFPTHAYAPTALDTLRSFKQELKAYQYLLGAIVPTSGPLRHFGAETLNGIRLALEHGKQTLGVTSVGLVIKDSAMDEFQFRFELGDMLGEYEPLAVIGPLLSRELAMVATIADQSETPFITPAATTTDVRRMGSYLFSTALTFSQQARRLAEYAFDRLELRRFCILYPEVGYGRELARLFSREVRQKGGDIVAVESYQESDTDFGPQINRIKKEDLKGEGQQNTERTDSGTTRVVYIPGFDGIFLPGDPAQIGLITAQLLFYDVKVAFLGGNTWNSPNLLRLVDRSLDGSIFVDGFFTDSPDPRVHEFVVRYRQRYRSDPTIFAAQAYDAARLVLEAIRRGASSGREVREQFVTFQSVPLLTGPAAFNAAGTLDRNVFVMQVKRGKVVQVD
ncbi:MAG: penicillin-binding protein activator [Nitrospiraceae bacterium]